MARIKGLTTFAGNFESEKSAPLVDMFCETVSDMISTTEQEAYDGNTYMYYGRKCIVFNDGTNNGTYQLIDPANPTVIASWEKMLGANDTPEMEDNRVSKYQVTTPFEANEVIDLTNGLGSIAGVCNHFGDTIDGVDRVLGTSAGDFFSDNAMSVYIFGQGQTYKSVGVIFDSPTTCHFPVPLNLGDAFWIERDAGMGTSVSGWASATEGTYAEIKALKDASNLVQGQWYKITDYQTSHVIPGTTDIHTDAIEPLILEAVSQDKFRVGCISSIYRDDEIDYDIDNSIIVGDNSIDGARYGGADSGDTITLDVTGPNTFTVNYEVIVNNSFNCYCQDDNGKSLDLDITNYSVDWSYADIGGGLYEITIDPSFGFDLTIVGNDYIEIEMSEKLGDRKGWITRRKNLINNLEAPYDFRGVQYRLYKLDDSGIQWDSGTTYNRRIFVSYNGHIYISTVNGNVGNTPPSNYNQWRVRIQANSAVDYKYTSQGLRGYNNIPVDLNDYKEVKTFNYLNGGNYYDGINYYSNVEYSSNYKEIPENIFITNGQKSDGIIIDRETTSNTFNNSISNSSFYKVYSNIFFSGITESYFGNTSNCTFSSIQNVKQSGNLYNSVFADSMRYNKFIKSYSNGIIGGSNYGNTFYDVYNLTASNGYYKNIISGYVYNLSFLGAPVYENEFKSVNSVSITGTQATRNNIVGYNFRYITINGIFRENTIGDYFQYNTLTASFHMNTIGNYFSGQNSSLPNIIGNSYRNNIADYFGRYGRCILDQGLDANNILANDQRNWVTNNNVSSNTITTPIQTFEVAGPVSHCSIHGEARNIYLTGGMYRVSIMGRLNTIHGGTMNDVTVLGSLLNTQFGDQMIGVQFNSGEDIDGNDFGEGFKLNQVSSLRNCTFNQNLGTVTQNNIFNKLPSGIDFTSATHVTQPYSCSLFTREGDVGVLSYVDNTGTQQIVSANI